MEAEKHSFGSIAHVKYGVESDADLENQYLITSTATVNDRAVVSPTFKRRRRVKVFAKHGLFLLLLLSLMAGLSAYSPIALRAINPWSRQTPWIPFRIGEEDDSFPFRPFRPDEDSASSDASSRCKGPRRSFTEHQTYGSITGEIELYDDLTLTTTTGSIDVIIHPQPGCGPQTLRIETATGSVTVTVADIPLRNGTFIADGITKKHSVFPWAKNNDTAHNRPISTSIITKTGTIRSSLILSHGATISQSSYTGTIDSTVRVPAVRPADPSSSLYTSTHTGHQYITVLAEDDRGKRNKNEATPYISFSARHRSKATGDIRLNYPHEWVGRVIAKALGTGSVDVTGEGLHYVKAGGQDVEAFRAPEHHHHHDDDDDDDIENQHQADNLILAESVGTGSVTFHC